MRITSSDVNASRLLDRSHAAKAKSKSSNVSLVRCSGRTNAAIKVGIRLVSRSKALSSVGVSSVMVSLNFFLAGHGDFLEGYLTGRSLNRM